MGPNRLQIRRRREHWVRLSNEKELRRGGRKERATDKMLAVWWL